MSEKERAEARARENMVARVKKHEEQRGNYNRTEESIRREVNQVAEKVDRQGGYKPNGSSN